MELLIREVLDLAAAARLLVAKGVAREGQLQGYKVGTFRGMPRTGTSGERRCILL